MEKSLFLLPYFLSLAISLGVLIYAWRHRHVRGAIAYTWYVAGQSLWILGYILELVHTGLEGKIFWDQVQWVAGLLIAIAFPVFAIQYTETKIPRPRLLFGSTFIMPSLLFVLLLTDNQHHLLYPNPYLDHTYVFSDLKYDFTWVVYAYAIYSYLITFTGLGILIRRLIRPHRLYRRQIITVAIGFFIPIFFTMLTTAGIEFMPFRDVTPFTFGIGNLVVAWGLFHYRLFDVIPIARDIVVENMEDLVVVLDLQDRIVDINPIALHTLEMKSSQVIGKPAATVFAPWPELVKRFFEPKNVKSEISLGSKDERNHFEIKSTLLYDKNNRYIGRVFVARNITERIELQKGLEKLNQELEERVAKRTEELLEGEERLRAVVDAAPFGAHLYQLESDDRLVLIGANRSADQVLHVDHQQYIGKTIEDVFPPLTETEIPAAYRRVATSGENLHREKLTITIADFSGVFEIHVFKTGEQRIAVFFRDITERHRAEEALRESEERFSTIAEAAFEGIVISDKGRVIDCNQQLATMLGYEQSEMIGLEVSRFVASESLDIVLEHIKSGSEEPYEHLSLRKDGTKFPVEIRAKSIPFKERQVRVTAIRDITDRKQAEETLRISEDRYRRLAENAPDIIFRYALNPMRKLEYISPAVERITGYTPEECYADPLFMLNVAHPDDAHLMAELLQSLGPLNKPIIMRWIGKDNVVRWMESRLVPVYDKSEQLVAVEGLTRDITERKQSEKKLAEAYDTTLEGWAKALELRDKETEDHSRRVTELTITLANAMGIEGDKLTHIRRGAILHDIGKMGIPDEILRKRGKLTIGEREKIEQHPVYSYELLSRIPFLEKALDIPYCHHEHWDGSGYPRGLKGEEIPLAARIFSVIDVWDAVQSDRPYNHAWPKEETIQYLKDETGKIFDPKCVSVFLILVAQGKI